MFPGRASTISFWIPLCFYIWEERKAGRRQNTLPACKMSVYRRYFLHGYGVVTVQRNATPEQAHALHRMMGEHSTASMKWRVLALLSKYCNRIERKNLFDGVLVFQSSQETRKRTTWPICWAIRGKTANLWNARTPLILLNHPSRT